MNAGNPAPKANSVILAEQRAALFALLPDAIEAIAQCIVKPSRNAQTKLAAAKTVLDRAGLPAVAATEISGSVNGEITITIAETLRQRRQAYLENQALLPSAGDGKAKIIETKGEEATES